MEWISIFFFVFHGNRKQKNRKCPQAHSIFCVFFFSWLGKRKNGKWTKISVLAINTIFVIFRFILNLEKWCVFTDPFLISHFFGQLKRNTNRFVDWYLLIPFFKKIEKFNWPVQCGQSTPARCEIFNNYNFYLLNLQF